MGNVISAELADNSSKKSNFEEITIAMDSSMFERLAAPHDITCLWKLQLIAS